MAPQEREKECLDTDRRLALDLLALLCSFLYLSSGGGISFLAL